MVSLASYIIYAFTNKDFTKEYQIEFTCVNREKESTYITLESNMVNKKFDQDNFVDEKRISDFTLITKKYQNGKQYDEEIIFAGDSIGEALDSLEKAKKLEGPVLVEDTSLCFNAYGGLPGAYIKYSLKAIKPEGLYKIACHFKDHSAYAKSIYGLQKNGRY